MRYSRLLMAGTLFSVVATVPTLRSFELPASHGEQAGSIPAGFTRIFNGRDLIGWHISRSNHHGTTGEWRIEKGVLIAAQRPLGQGGILLTDRKYKDFELYLEVNPDHDTDGGIFLRSTETGSGYQVDLTPRGENPPVMGLLGEDLRLGPRTDLAERRSTEGVWKMHDWNSVRIRMTGEAPRVTLWLNDTMIWDVQQSRNDLLADVTGGMIALQLHWNAWARWIRRRRHRQMLA